jgi:hypothetical protein
MIKRKKQAAEIDQDKLTEEQSSVGVEKDLTTVEVSLDSLEANVGYGSLLRELQHAYIERVAYYRSKTGGALSLEEARAKAYHACTDEAEANRIYDQMMSYPLDCLDFVDLAEMWPVAPRIAEGIWEKIKDEAGDKFESGHLATEAICPARYMRTAWNVASYLGLRESFIAEWQPRGGIELSLIDILAQAFLQYQYWVKQAVVRTQTEARHEAEGYTAWKQGKREEYKAYGWLPGHWDIPYVPEQQAIEHAAIMADRWNRIYMRTLRNLRDLRRYSVTINSPQQVNIASEGAQQLNIKE